ncbi:MULTISPECIES: winged helix-turn-helix domain-containing protein [unclassified Haloferax]|jgi:DNA-binding MarR family transcriptional regulator|uniref:ArsR/SmtB family transcription factor n=1 Tax=unclassified Haloferax TaxID=2625095 RepID=UPI00287651A4|nr:MULTISPECIES: winged helix-turn-helix domain-containing protein [unclassified Haloferax]MDS0241364.1 helix-turn-helix domain-containing protein [Haloferax sp. S2CR25]MDS0444485.1 helix-turn-helix domain-containing protein [Haloferax sp. S2CR25-2]
MAAETGPTTAAPDEGELEQYVDQRLFDDSMGALADHTARKAALGDERRYAILFLLWEREEVARKELAVAIDDDRYDLSHHLGELVDAGLIARTGAPEDADGRQTFYTITHLGRQEIESDYRSITGFDHSQ